MKITKDSKIYIAGHKGMVGAAIWRKLTSCGYSRLFGFSSQEIDLKDQASVNMLFQKHTFDVVIDAAAKVGGILANQSYPYQFLYDNLQIQNNLMNAANSNGVQKFIFLGSSCIYPKLAPQPLKEEYLLTDTLEPSNQWYAIAKIAGVKLCEAIRNQFQKDFVSLMPTNLYGIHDNFDVSSSHVLPAMIRKFHDAKVHQKYSVVLWGSGTPLREFLYVDDMADAILFTLAHTLPEHLYNVGTSSDLSIKALAQMVQEVVGYQGDIEWDASKPDGTPRKLMDVSKLEALGWKHRTPLKEGIRKTYEWFLTNGDQIKEVKF